MLLAVHISDGILSLPWLSVGFALAWALIYVGIWRIQDEEIPRIALLTAAFFIASLFHVRVGPTSVHLILNGLVGVLLGRRAGLAIAIGLFLQVLLIQHGGYFTLGINTCIMTFPALLAFVLFRSFHRLPWLSNPWFRSLLVGVGTLLWVLSSIYSIALLWTHASFDLTGVDLTGANAILLQPMTWLACGCLVVLVIWAERRLELAPEFPLGLLIGEITVLATLVLNCTVLLVGGEKVWQVSALVWVIAHLPIAAIEAIILGFTVGFLAKVKPQMLGLGAHPEGLVSFKSNNLDLGEANHHAHTDRSA